MNFVSSLPQLKLNSSICATLTSIFVLVSCELFAQQKNTLVLPKVVSPQAYQFTKYLDVPISNYTGVPEIEIPIYTIPVEGLEIPLSLRYHSNGIKVSEEASEIGLGWNLSGGGSVVQVVNGYDDYSLYGIMESADPIQFNIPGGFSSCQSKTIEYSTDMPNIDHGTIWPMVNGGRDSERDIFKYSFLNYSGDFFYDYDASAFVCLTDKNVIVKYSAPTATFYITVPDGHTFHFVLADMTRIDVNGTTTVPYTGASSPVDLSGFASSRLYQLTTVITNKGEQVDYIYEFSQKIQNFPSFSTASITNIISPFSSKGPHSDEMFPAHQSSYSILATSQKFSYLKMIQSNKSVVEFTNAVGRRDISGAFQLNNITVKSRQDNSVVSSFALAYDYFRGQPGGPDVEKEMVGTNLIKTEDEKLMRLKLVSVTEQGENPYKLFYNPGTLPSKTSLEFDHWGFYNSYAESSMLNRGPSDLNSSKIGVLESMIYPTGGKVKFDYELNELDDPTISPHYEVFPGTIYLYDKNWTNGYVSEPGEYGYIVGDAGLTAWIMVPAGGSGFVDLQKILSVDGCSSNPNNEMYYPNATWSITSYNYLAGAMVEAQGWSAIPAFVGNPSYITNAEEGKIKTGENHFKEWPAIKMALSPGIYFFSVSLNNSCGPQDSMGENAFAYMKLQYAISKLLDVSTGSGAGLRVKNVSLFDENDVQQKFTKYEYSGPRIMSKPVFENSNHLRFTYMDSHICYPPFGNDQNECCELATLFIETKTWSSRSFMEPSVNASGNFVGYDQVVVREIDFKNQSNNGHVSYTYVNQPDRIEVNDLTMPSVKPDRQNGLLLNETFYNSENLPLQSTSYAYDEVKLPCYWNMRSRLKEQRFAVAYGCQISCNCAAFIYFYELGFYPIKRVKSLLSTKTQVQYDGALKQIYKEVYEYDINDQIAKKTIIDSRGDTETTTFTYPYNHPANPVFTKMVSENAISQVVVQENKKNNILTEYTMNEFKETHSFTNVFPYKFFAKNIVSTKYKADSELLKEYELQLFYKNKPLQYLGKDGVVVSFIWGYKSEYLVAKVTNATYAQVVGLLNPHILNSPSSDVALRTELAKIRNALPKAQVITYTHRPLVGITSVTNENGFVEYYEYSANRRLRAVKDHYGNIVKHYQYHFFSSE